MYICDSTYQKVPAVRKLDFELLGCKVKVSQNMVLRSILGISHILESSIHTFLLHEGFDVKITFSFKNSHFNCYLHQYIAQIHKLKELFSQNQFSLICYDVINEITILRMQCPIPEVYTPKLS